jgi:hypothetical protein
VREELGPAGVSMARYDDPNIPIALLEGGDSTRRVDSDADNQE